MRRKLECNEALLPWAGVDVELVSWPPDNDRLEAMRASGQPRLLLITGEVDPPVSGDPLEDWVRLPTTAEDLRARIAGLVERRDAVGELRAEAG